MTDQAEFDQNGAFEGLISRMKKSGLRPPPDLRDRCLPSDPAVLKAPLLTPWALATLRRRPLLTYTALPALTALVSLICVGLPIIRSRSELASAALLGAAISDLGRVSAVHVSTHIDDGPGSPVKESWETWSVRDLGHRTEDEHLLSIYNIPKAEMYVLDRTTNTMTTTKLDESGLTLEFLRRGLPEESVLVVCMHQAESNSRTITDELVDEADRTLRRITAIDDRGHPIQVNIDPRTNLVTQTESWTFPLESSPSVRVVTTFDYPAFEAIDRTLFELPAQQGVVTQETAPDQRAMMQCLFNLQDTFAALTSYSAAHGGELPADLDPALRDWEGFRESMLYCPLSSPGAEHRYLWDTRELKAPFDELDSDAVLMQCKRHPGGTIELYGDGHAMFVQEAP